MTRRTRLNPTATSYDTVAGQLRHDEIVAPSLGRDAVTARQVATLQRWLEWLDANGAKGSITEIGFPGLTTNATNAGQTILNWGPVAETIFSLLDPTDVTVSQWADPAGQFMLVSGAQTPTPRFTTAAQPLLRHRYAAGVRAIQAGGAVGVAPPVGYSNSNPSTGSNWFPLPAWYAMVAAAGLTVVRLSFRWETLQPTLNGALNSTELARIQSAVANANAAGLRVILDLHNYAEYITTGGPQKLGAGLLTQAHLVDVWTKLSNVFKGDTRVYAYELMNEPFNVTGGASAWETATQTVLSAVRSNSDTTLILVPGYDFSAMSRWTTYHPAGWITDTANNFRYNAHFYMSSSSSSDADYNITWAQEVAAQLFPGSVGHVPLGPDMLGDRPAWSLQPQVGELTTPRHGLVTTAALTSGIINFTYFRAQKSETITKIRFRVNTTAGTTPTLARVGVYRANADGSLTPISLVASDPAMLTTFGTNEKTLPTTWYKKAGAWYAIAMLDVQSSGTMPILAGMGGSFEWDQWPYTAMALWSQTDLPSSTIPKNSLSSSSAIYHSYHVL